MVNGKTYQVRYLMQEGVKKITLQDCINWEKHCLKVYEIKDTISDLLPKIEKDETLLEIGTDKVDSEIPSPAAGVLVEILAKPNDVVDVGKVIGRINNDGDSIKTPIVSDIPESEEEDVQEIKAPNLDIEKDEDDGLGISFTEALFDGLKQCNNNCPFCFIDQQPAGRRKRRRKYS